MIVIGDYARFFFKLLFTQEFIVFTRVDIVIYVLQLFVPFFYCFVTLVIVFFLYTKYVCTSTQILIESQS